MHNNKETLSSYCFNEIKKLILNCKLLPNEKIKGDYLKHELNIGLSPIREGLSRLITTGLVELVDNVGFKVADISYEKICDFYTSYAKLEQMLFLESIENHDEPWESKVVSSLYQLAKIENSITKATYSEWSICNDKFHESLVSGSKLNELNKTFEQMNIRKSWYHNLAYGIDNHKLISISHREHNKIAELALKREKELACNMLYQHTMQGFELIIINLKKHKLINS
ncbi:MAG: GntR family transcriptional regulator [Burkholderiales bacterium]|nr:GntR family transcriptional regulator [Burkholderiales bacterium]